MNPTTITVVATMLVAQSTIPDIAAQLSVDGASPFAMIGLRAAALAVGIVLNLLDPVGRIRRQAQTEPALIQQG